MEEKQEQTNTVNEETTSQTISPIESAAQVDNGPLTEVAPEIPEQKIEDNQQAPAAQPVEEPKVDDQPVEEPKVEVPKNSDLQAQVIGELPQEKQKGAFWVLIFFGLLIGFVVGLPYLQDYLKEKNKPVEVVEPNKEENKTDEKTGKAVEQTYYELNSEEPLKFNDLSISKVNKEQTDDYYLTLSVTNTAKETYNFDKNYYVELYNKDKTLLERTKLISDQPAMNNQELNIKLLISENSYNNVELISLVEKTEEDYPEVSLKTKEEEMDVLTCTNKNSSIKYYFTESKLTKIVDVYNYSGSDAASYNEVLKTYQNLAATYNNVEGVSSNITDTNLSFTMNTQIDLTKANIDSLKNKNYYKKDIAPKAIKFEMEAMRYSCS